jgi:hypothetical protein
MNVAQLKEALTNLPDDCLVVLAKDAEGNTFSPVEELSEGLYSPIRSWFGDFIQLENVGDENYFQLPEGIPAVVIWPVN